MELREVKLALENELAAARAEIKETIEDAHRRVRKLRDEIAQTASAKAGLLEFVEQAELGDLSAPQRRNLRDIVESDLRSFRLPNAMPDAPAATEAVELLKAAEEEVRQARRSLKKAAIRADRDSR